MRRPHRAGPSRYLSIILKQQIRSSCAPLTATSAPHSNPPIQLPQQFLRLHHKRYGARPGRRAVTHLTPLKLGPGAPARARVLALSWGDAGASPLLRQMAAVLLTRRGCPLAGLVRRAGLASRRSTCCQCAALPTRRRGPVLAGLQQSGFSSRCPGLRLCKGTRSNNTTRAKYSYESNRL